MPLVTNNLQFINLPEVIETETALWEFPCKAIGGLIGSQKKFKLKYVLKLGKTME